MIIIKQTQKKIGFCAAQYFKKAQTILRHLGYKNFDLGILLTTNATIKKYNREFRQKDEPTDVLSFPYHSELKAGQKIVVFEPEDKNLGDIIISVPYVFSNKKDMPGTFEQRMDVMLVHAICHLLGYDHVDDDDFEKMDQLEKELLKLIS